VGKLSEDKSPPAVPFELPIMIVEFDNHVESDETMQPKYKKKTFQKRTFFQDKEITYLMVVDLR